ncbi:uncharacterized protein LOC122756614 [Drosophila santomea]|uniref:uncharacterized protein LOC122756614 n=1 Tax=Drosophila santomea TaxID=129105 RepID=UPI001CCEB40D|nr:uncharacterized protein LOC122756614 [Drosophila santomea]
MATKTVSLDKRQAVPAIQTGMDRYIQIKRKLSPPNTVGNKPKINRTNKSTDQTRSSNENRFSILAEADNNQPELEQETQRKPKPPPIYVREKSSSTLVNKIVALVGDENFYVVPLIKGNIHETKVQTKSEEHFRAVYKYLEDTKKNFYTYQLKNSKGLQVVLKGTKIEPNHLPYISEASSSRSPQQMIMFLRKSTSKLNPRQLHFSRTRSQKSSGS